MKTENVYISLADEEKPIKKTKGTKYDYQKYQLEEIKRPIHLTNSFGIMKYKGIPNKQIFTTISKRLNKYDPNSFIKQKELIINSRNDSISDEKLNLKNNDNKKLNFLNFRKKKYRPESIYRVSLKIQEPESDYSEITHLNNLYKSLFESPKKKDLAMSLYNHQRPHITNALYTVLAMKKNQFMEVYNQAKEQEKAALPKVKQIVDTSLIGNIYRKKNDYKKYIDSYDGPFTYISLLDEDYSISEKSRFQKIMDKLTKIKRYLDENPRKDKEIIKEFIHSNGIYDLDEYLNYEKIERFRKFLRGNFLIDPSKNIKETIIDILEGNQIHQPPISSALDCFKNNKKSISQKKSEIHKYKKKLEKMEGIDDYMNKKLDKTNLRKDLRKNIIKHKMLCQSLDNDFERQDLFSNLQRQKELYLMDKTKKELDIVNKPKNIVDMLESTFKEQEKKDNDIKTMTHVNFGQNINKNNKKLQKKKKEIEYSELRKKNLLTEYICLMKARNNYEISKLKKKFGLFE